MKISAKKLALLALISLVVIVIFFFIEVFLFLNNAPSTHKHEKIFEVQRGAPFRLVAKQLKREGLITNDVKFYLLAKHQGKVEKIKAGEYLLNTHLKPENVLDILVSGRTYLHKVMIPEGYNMYQIGEVISGLSLSTSTKKDFLKMAKDPALLRSLNISGSSAEGYLFPESYFFSKPITHKKIIETMVSRFRENYTEDIARRARKRKLSQREVIILASIIEKETGVSRERRLISAVLHNRLKRGMKLQMDPTVIYGIYETFNGNLTKRDLLTRTPYNTYVRKGLPAGPIANPGRASLEAAVNPAPVKYLYFVSKNDGSHIFSVRYRDHIRAVNRYQKNNRH